MISTLHPSTNSFSISGLNGLNNDGTFSYEGQIAENIQSIYFLANTIVSKASEIANEEKKRVLIVDDEPLTFELIHEFLLEANMNFIAQAATTAEEAIEMVNSKAPDLIITDWLLPEIDGLELTRNLKANPITRQIPIIVVTGLIPTHQELESILQAGALDILRKPIDYGELVARVRVALKLEESLKEVTLQTQSINIKNQVIDFLIEAAPSAIFYLDGFGRFLGCNKTLERLLQKSRERIVGKLASEFLPKEMTEKLGVYLVRAIKNNGLQQFETGFSDAGGNRRVLFSLWGFGDLYNGCVIGSAIDIPEIIEARANQLMRIKISQNPEKNQTTNEVEKLQTELDFKHREVAMHLELLIHSRGVKEKLIEGVNKLQPYLNNEGKSKFFTLLKQLKWELKEEVDLNLEKKFDETNLWLYTLLERRCPEITKNEKRLCAFLKMNHCVTDIAKITDKSLNSINVALARLRTKLQIPNTKDLRVYINELAPASLELR